MIDYYQVLEVSPNAAPAQIKEQYRLLVQAWHPDKFASESSRTRAEEKLKLINEAYAVLKDERRRMLFDHERYQASIAAAVTVDTAQDESRRQAARTAVEKGVAQTRGQAEEKIHQQRMDTLENARRLEWLKRSSALNLQLSEGVLLSFVRVPAGEFLMGSDSVTDLQARPDEKPQHRVHLPEFLIGQAPVTNRQYLSYVVSTSSPRPGSWQYGELPAGREDHPVSGLSWKEAAAFCQWVSRQTGMKVRLPSEAEWEKAARGTDGRLYPWGNTDPGPVLTQFAQGVTAPVDAFPLGASPYAALSLSGNVYEWVSDYYQSNYYLSSPLQAPSGPVWGESHVLRGGGFASPPDALRAASRFHDLPASPGTQYGFRCALTI
ncbi:MAG: SUMF1/EgtB/PvdO family nonheme iron enzyme [Chloroflexota bacterium]